MGLFRYSTIVAYLSTFLFANPSFLDGVAHLLDFEGNCTAYNVGRGGQEADVRALYADWLSVGITLDDAMTKISAKQFVEAR